MSENELREKTERFAGRSWRVLRIGLLIPVYWFLWNAMDFWAFTFLCCVLVAGYLSMFALRQREVETPLALLWMQTAEMGVNFGVMTTIFFVKIMHEQEELPRMLLVGTVLLGIRMVAYPLFSLSMVREKKSFQRESFWSRASKLVITATMMIYVLPIQRLTSIEELEHLSEISMGVSILLMFAACVAYLYWYYRDPDHRQGLSVASQLTMSRIVLTPVFIWVFFYDNDLDYKNNLLIFKVLALVMVVAFMVTDFLDGYLARKMGEVSTLGKYLDPFSDKVSNMSIFLCFMASDYAAVWMVALIYFREASVETLRTLAASQNVIMPARQSGKWKTAIQGMGILIILIGALEPVHSLLPNYDTFIVPQWVMGFITLVTLLSGIDYFYSSRKLLLKFL